MIAPLVWLLLRVAQGYPAGLEVETHLGLYLYMWLGATFALGMFGWGLGKREDRLQQLNAKLKRLSLTDDLTSLKNSRYFWSRFDEALAEAKRAGEEVSLVLFDLDHFKRVNDTHGHAMGDRILAHVGHVMSEVVRRGETAARVGGEEFALLMPRSTESEAHAAAERIRRAIAQDSFESTAGSPVRVTLSAGVVSTERVGRVSSQELFDFADAALYESKGGGRDRVSLADEDSDVSEVSRERRPSGSWNDPRNPRRR